jgi:hypothetical protein
VESIAAFSLYSVAAIPLFDASIHVLFYSSSKQPMAYSSHVTRHTPQESRNWPRDILSFMRPLMWTLGAFRPNARLFELLSVWFYRHPNLSAFRLSLTKPVQQPSAWSSAAASSVESHKCDVMLAGDETAPRLPCI